VEGLRLFAAEAGLDFARTGALEGPWSVLRWGRTRRVAGIVRGLLPGGREGLLAGCVIGAPGPDGAPAEFPHLLAAAEIPEAPASLGWVEVRSREARELGQLPPGAVFGDGPVRDLGLESEFFAGRFELAAGPATDPGAVVQLFSPVFLHWYAYEAPYAMSMELLGGRLCLHAPADLRNRDRARSIWTALERIEAAVASEAREER
jgi:hypothetical protein